MRTSSAHAQTHIREEKKLQKPHKNFFQIQSSHIKTRRSIY
jgi:hypothetical protein